jgi:predicted DNA-binding transcriptional regulator YafY
MHPIQTQILLYIQQQSRYGHAVKSEEIVRHLENCDNPLGIRQVQRHLKALQELDYIDKNPRHKSYFADIEHLEASSDRQDRLERGLALDSLLKANNSAHPLGHPIISFEAFNAFKGAHHLAPLISAIRNSKVIKFHYRNYYQANADSDRVVQALFLKEYLNRWYLMSWDLEKNQARLFGIDRIVNLEITDQKFDPQVHYEDCWQRFDSVIGLRYSDGDQSLEAMELLIRVQDIHVPFMESLPLHPSQEKLVDPKDRAHQTRFRLRVAPNFELEQRLLSMSHLIEVEEPKWYRQQFKAKLKRMLKQYQ